jgi:ubiquitin-conjugating enzyme E2 J1
MSSDAVKRIMAEVREFAALNSQPGAFFTAAPLETDLFEWHFTVRGPPATAFASGLYHGRILLPPEYPLKAPEIILLTPNGRFEVGTRICLSVTAHHNETWQPSWGVRTILTALVGFMPSKAEGLGALDYNDAERRLLARKSLAFTCTRCGAVPAEQFPAELEAMKPAADAGSSSSSVVPHVDAEQRDVVVAMATSSNAQANMEEPEANGVSVSREETGDLPMAGADTPKPATVEPPPVQAAEPVPASTRMPAPAPATVPAPTFSPISGAASQVTAEPVTTAPVTATPMTAAPMTVAPVSTAPVTAAPVTVAPVTAATVTAVPETSSAEIADPMTAAPVPRAEADQTASLNAVAVQSPSRNQEKELLYLAYAIGAAIVAIIARRIIRAFS